MRQNFQELSRFTKSYPAGARVPQTLALWLICRKMQENISHALPNWLMQKLRLYLSVRNVIRHFWHAGETSLNYLALDVLEASGLPIPAAMSSLEEVRGEYPVVTAIGVVDKEGNLLEAKECAEGLRAYQSQLYYLLFDYEE